MKGQVLILAAGALGLGAYFLLRKPSEASAAQRSQLGAAAASELQTLQPNTQAAIRVLLDPSSNATEDAYTSAMAQLQTADKPALVQLLVDIYQEKFQ